MSKQIIKQMEIVKPGDLIAVDWCDASIGKSSGLGMSIDVPVRSWGVFIGMIGDRVKHIVIAHNSFRYSDGLFDLDYTAIPVGWALGAVVLLKEHVPSELANRLVNSFMTGGHSSFNRSRTFRRALAQRRLSIDGGHY